MNNKEIDEKPLNVSEVKKFEDCSCFQGIKEFHDGNGQFFMTVHECGNFWRVFIWQGDAYVSSGLVKLKRKATCENIYDAFLDLEKILEMEDE